MVSDRAYLRLFQMDDRILTQSEIRRLLDDELTKDDPDTELIGYCLDALDEREFLPPMPVTIKRFSVKTAVAAAAVQERCRGGDEFTCRRGWGPGQGVFAPVTGHIHTDRSVLGVMRERRLHHASTERPQVVWGAEGDDGLQSP